MNMLKSCCPRTVTFLAGLGIRFLLLTDSQSSGHVVLGVSIKTAGSPDVLLTLILKSEGMMLLHGKLGQSRTDMSSCDKMVSRPH